MNPADVLDMGGTGGILVASHLVGTEMRRITDERPMVGAVAWWRANVPGAGSVGHVAYVERVDGSAITVSEAAWNPNLPDCGDNVIRMRSGIPA